MSSKTISTKQLMSENTHMLNSKFFLNQELSLLQFNRRVIAQAQDNSLPLLERLRYLCIGSSNLDEFFEVRVASLHAKLFPDKTKTINSHGLLHKISEECHAIVNQQYNILNRDILPALAKNGVHILAHQDRNEAQKAWVKQYFEEQIKPLLTPIVLDPAHPFPQVPNKSLNFIVSLAGKDAFGRGSATAIVKAPRVLPRVVRLPDELSNDGICLCLLTSIIHAHISDLFTERKVIAYSQFRVTRDSDLWVDEDEVKNLRQALKASLKNRHLGTAIRLEVARNCPDNLAQCLLDQFNLDEDHLYRVNGPVNLTRLTELFNYVKSSHLYFPVFTPSVHPAVNVNANIFDTLKKKDILLHHPYQSFQTVVDFIQAAADDPDVLVIKQTIYRVGMSSELVPALISAANKGKEVVVIVELKARFDEEQNIDWAQQLEQAGAQVVYGVMGLKTHAKMALIMRREKGKFNYYCHLGTGNYHNNTTKIYTDFGILTSNPALTQEVNEIFIHVTSLTKPKKLDNLWLAPFSLHRKLIQAIINEIRIARKGRPARIIAKMNSLIDESVIRALYLASSAGVKIDLIVRGACALKPGVPGLSENIKVRSIIGRFLEHERVYYFRNDLKHDVYIASADWMGRNLFRRVEVACPIFDPEVKKQIIEESLKTYLKDNTNTWELLPNGQYRRYKTRKKQSGFGAQQYLASIYDANGPGKPDAKKKKPKEPEKENSSKKTIVSPLVETLPLDSKEKPTQPPLKKENNAADRTTKATKKSTTSVARKKTKAAASTTALVKTESPTKKTGEKKETT